MHIELDRRSRQLPSQTLLDALMQMGEIAAPHFANDLGCGAGPDAVELVSRGWQVLAIDKDQRFVDRLREKDVNGPLTARVQQWENLSLPPADLVNASFSLPFCRPRYFLRCWNTIREAILPGGFFSGHFFGVHDEWSDRAAMTFHRKEDMFTLFRDFDLLRLEEIEEEGTAAGLAKHWHLFAVVARKREAAGLAG
ncbi:MAG TPA: class I SAM-dependent methyltransferase [Puia sp.]|uniref:class I SAM-dependent methyltransferase n=1 Tax=Puia sp. TaxID=2045100 RepID=UPI002BF401F4|nr:class I SAM-dependent methyltransferase [Puia sp.]HVU94708.1 class I SAM-dependent methyltransferase [Puia sp.]